MFYERESIFNAAKVVIIVSFILITTKHIEAARLLENQKSTKIRADCEVSFPQSKGPVPPSAPNPLIPELADGPCN